MNLVDEADLLTLMEEEDAEVYTAEKEAVAQAEKKPLTPMQITPRTRAILRFLWRMSRKKPARRIPNPSDFKAAFCRRTYPNENRLEGTLISTLVVAEKPSVAMSYAKVLGATSRKDGYLEGNGYLVSWCIGHLVELAPPNVYDAKYVKWSIADLPILPQKWQYLVSASTKKQFGILQKLMHRPDVDSIVNSCDAGQCGWVT